MPTMPADDGFGIGSSEDYDYDYCGRQETIDTYPDHTFSVAAFAAGYGSASPVVSSLGHMYDLNILTTNQAEIIEQLDLLRAHADAGIPVNDLEFGNELFIEKHYAGWFATADVYMEKILPGLEYARAIFPDAKIAVSAAYRFCGDTFESMVAWNEVLANYTEYFDAVTVHDYSACYQSVDSDLYAAGDRRSALAAWGEVQLDDHARFISSFLGDDKELWITEWSIANFVGPPLSLEAHYDFDTTLNTGYGTPSTRILRCHAGSLMLVRLS